MTLAVFWHSLDCWFRLYYQVSGTLGLLYLVRKGSNCNAGSQGWSTHEEYSQLCFASIPIMTGLHVCLRIRSWLHGVVLFVASLALSTQGVSTTEFTSATWTLANSSSSRFLSDLELGDPWVSIWWTYWCEYSNRARSYSEVNVPANRTISSLPEHRFTYTKQTGATLDGLRRPVCFFLTVPTTNFTRVFYQYRRRSLALISRSRLKRRTKTHSTGQLSCHL
jgi:hypothetical protein